MLITQDELEKKGLELSLKAKKTDLDSLTEDELHTLMLYEVWKDGADWNIVLEHDKDEFWKASYNVKSYLTEVFGY